LEAISPVIRHWLKLLTTRGGFTAACKSRREIGEVSPTELAWRQHGHLRCVPGDTHDGCRRPRAGSRADHPRRRRERDSWAAPHFPLSQISPRRARVPGQGVKGASAAHFICLGASQPGARATRGAPPSSAWWLASVPWHTGPTHQRRKCA
jgi:hypothetical protein